MCNRLKIFSIIFKNYIKKFPLIMKFKSYMFSLFDENQRQVTVKPFRDFPLYIPYTGNSFKKKTQWIFEGINKIFPLLYSLGKYVNKSKEVELQNIEELYSDPKSKLNDGLHTPHSNIASLEFGLKCAKVGGWIVIEDIGTPAIDLWKVVALFLPNNYKSHIFLSKYESHFFAVKRLS